MCIKVVNMYKWHKTKLLCTEKKKTELYESKVCTEN